MINENFNKICLAFDNYKEYYSLGHGGSKSEAYEELYKDLSDLIRILLKNNQQIKIYSEDGGIIVQYNYKGEDMSGVRLEWLGEDSIILSDEAYHKYLEDINNLIDEKLLKNEE